MNSFVNPLLLIFLASVPAADICRKNFETAAALSAVDPSEEATKRRVLWHYLLSIHQEKCTPLYTMFYVRCAMTQASWCNVSEPRVNGVWPAPVYVQTILLQRR